MIRWRGVCASLRVRFWACNFRAGVEQRQPTTAASGYGERRLSERSPTDNLRPEAADMYGRSLWMLRSCPKRKLGFGSGARWRPSSPPNSSMMSLLTHTDQHDAGHRSHHDLQRDVFKTPTSSTRTDWRHHNIFTVVGDENTQPPFLMTSFWK